MISIDACAAGWYGYVLLCVCAVWAHHIHTQKWEREMQRGVIIHKCISKKFSRKLLCSLCPSQRRSSWIYSFHVHSPAQFGSHASHRRRETDRLTHSLSHNVEMCVCTFDAMHLSIENRTLNIFVFRLYIYNFLFFCFDFQPYDETTSSRLLLLMKETRYANDLIRCEPNQSNEVN